MQLLENIDTIVSVVCGIGSIVMFFLAKNEKDKCIEIKNQIEQNINVSKKQSEISSEDTFKINNVKNFDNRKSIR